jgi:hypothetical protein
MSATLWAPPPSRTDAVAQFVVPHTANRSGHLVEVNDMRCRAGEMSGYIGWSRANRLIALRDARSAILLGTTPF